VNATSSSLIHSIAHNYRLCLADFPLNLKPEHLDVPAGEQAILFAGFSILRAVIGDIYDHFAHLTPTEGHWSDREYCYRAIEGAVKLLWALGAVGQLVQGPGGLELQVSRENLDEALKRCGVKNSTAAFVVLESVGFNIIYHGADGLTCPGGFKKCVAVTVRYPPHNDPLLYAVAYYAVHLPEKKSANKKKSIIFEIYLRADFRPLLPGYTFHIPHLPAEEEEVTRTFDPATLEVWRELTGFMASRHPQYRLFFRVPRIRNRGWVADYSTKENDYGLWSIFVEEGGLYVRIVFNAKTLPNLLGHINELSPHFQETYLTSVACKDCVRCGKHVFYTHGDHVHRLCKSPWYFSPYLGLEDLPDIERLVDFRLANL
jgi:hypothetical protein